MEHCPVCLEHHAHYYQCYRGALAKLLGVFPTLTDRVEEWRLILEPTIRHPDDFRERFGWRAFQRYLELTQAQDLFLILVCHRCAIAGAKRLGLLPFELYCNEALQCPCCGYHTIADARVENCDVCGWHDCGCLCGRRTAVLAEARHNYTYYGAVNLQHVDDTRPPALQELPRYNR